MGKVVKEYTFLDLDVQGDIFVTGKVDGVDVSDHAADETIHHAHHNLANLNLVDQNLGTAGAPVFAGLTVKGNIAVTGTVDGVDVSAHAADAAVHHPHANKANLDAVNQNLGTANAPAFAGLTVSGDIAVTGRVDGVDVSDHAGNAVIHHSHANKANLDAVNQNLGTANAPAFAGLTVNGNVAVTGNVDGVKVSGHGARHRTGGADVLTGNLDANARVQVRANGTAVGTRRAINFMAGENVTLSVADHAGSEAVNVTISATGGPSPTDIITVPGVAGEALAAYDLCYLAADGRYYKTDSLTAATMPGLVLAGAALTAGQAGSFIRRGQVSNNAWAWATVGGFVYAGNTAGALTQTLPSKSGEQLQIVGIAKSATQIDFEPNLLLVEVA